MTEPRVSQPLAVQAVETMFILERPGDVKVSQPLAVQAVETHFFVCL